GRGPRPPGAGGAKPARAPGGDRAGDGRVPGIQPATEAAPERSSVRQLPAQVRPPGPVPRRYRSAAGSAMVLLFVIYLVVRGGLEAGYWGGPGNMDPSKPGELTTLDRVCDRGDQRIFANPNEGKRLAVEGYLALPDSLPSYTDKSAALLLRA